MSTIQQLQEQFGIANTLTITTHPSGWPLIHIHNQHASAEIHLYAAHITHFQPHGQEPILWLSKQAIYREGKALRGGIPIIWPWFGPHPTDQTLPQHGFGRNRFWQIAQTKQHDDGSTVVQLVLTDSEETHSVWPHRFRLTLTITVGRALEVTLEMHHQEDKPVDITAALHTYFTVADINQVTIEGLDSTPYLDKTTGYTQKTQTGEITITAETDRVYVPTTADCLIKDHTLQRTIRVSKAGSQSTVVWNPWQEKAQGMGDFPDDGYKTMVCVETTNATAQDTVTLTPQATHQLTTKISVEPLEI